MIDLTDLYNREVELIETNSGYDVRLKEKGIITRDTIYTIMNESLSEDKAQKLAEKISKKYNCDIVELNHKRR